MSLPDHEIDATIDCSDMQLKDAWPESAPAPGTPAAQGADALTLVRQEPPYRRGGYVRACTGGSILAVGLGRYAGVGTTCRVEGTGGAGLGDTMLAEVVGFGERGSTLLPYGPPQGVRSGARVVLDPATAYLRPDPAWRERVLDPLGGPAGAGVP